MSASWRGWLRGLTDAQLDAYELHAELAMVNALQAVADQVADRIAQIQVASARVLWDGCPHGWHPAHDGPCTLVAQGGDVPDLPPGQPYVSPDDLASIPPLWDQQVHGTLQPLVAEVYHTSSGTVYAELVDATNMSSLPSVSSQAAEQYLAAAANTFEEVGGDLWETARNELLDGFQQGESIPELAQRVRGSAGLTAKRATLVARTQVLDASNAGSIATARASGLALRKMWLATPDLRTRPSHVIAGETYGGDDEAIPLADRFTVGGFSCDRPHDPILPPAERYSCRCTLGYTVGARAATPVIEAQEPPLPGTAPAVEVPEVIPARIPRAPARPQAITPVQFDEALRTAAAGERALKIPPIRMTDVRAGRETFADLLPDEQTRRAGFDLIEGYVDTPREINLFLRGGDSRMTPAVRTEFDRDIATIDAVLDASPLTEDVIVYRGLITGRSAFGPKETWDNDLTGREWTESAYQSTSALEAVGKHYSRGGVLMRILVPRGTRAIQVSAENYESEILLQRGLTLRVVRDRGTDDDGRRIVDVEVASDRALAAPGPAAGPTTVAREVAVRPVLQQAKSTRQLQQAMRAEVQRITGRDMLIQVPDDASLATMRQFYEGVLRGMERFPDTSVRTVAWWRVPDGHYADTSAGEIRFNAWWAQAEQRRKLLGAVRGDVADWDRPGLRGWMPRNAGTVDSLGMHEYGHAVHLSLGAETATVSSRALTIVQRRAALEGITPDEAVARHLGAYSTSDEFELIAGAFTDVMVNGDLASPLAREIFDLLEDAYRRGGKRVGITPEITARAVPRPVDFETRIRAAKAGDSAIERVTPIHVEVDASAGAETSRWRAGVITGIEGRAPSGASTALTSYLRQPGFMNARLRTPVPDKSPDGWRTWLHEPSFQELSGQAPFDEVAEAAARAKADRQIAALDALMDRSRLRSDVVVWRGASASDVALPRVGQAVGFEWTDQGFVSTAVRRGYAENDFAQGETRVLLRILVPEETQAVSLGAAEGELLLTRGLRFRIVGEQERAIGGARVIDVEIVPSAPVPVEIPLARRTIAELRTLAKDRGVTVPAGARKADIVRLLEGGKPPAPAVVPLAKRPVAELRKLAAERDIPVPKGALKAELVRRLELSPAEVEKLRRRALREAARERNRLLEQATGTARLLAEIDRLLAVKAESRVIRESLDEALIAPEQLFANADPAVLRALLDVVDDPVKLRAAVTRLGTKAKIKPVGKAEAKVKFDPDTMEPVGGEIKAGIQVTVVSRGASVTLPDGSVVQIAKAKVTPVGGARMVGRVPKPVEKVPAAEMARAKKILGSRDAQSIYPWDLSDIRGFFGSETDLQWIQRFADRHPETFMRIIQDRNLRENYREWRIQFAVRGSTAEVRAKMVAEMRKQLHDAPIMVRRQRESSLRDILERGRMRTQFETGTSSGTLNNDLRASYEQMAWGYARDLDPTLRPVYGYLAPGGIDSISDAVGQYGSIRIRLKESIRPRTSFTIVDSLGGWKQVLPTPVDDPGWQSFNVTPYMGGYRAPGPLGRDYSSQEFRRGNYVEAQIHGGVRVEDIEEVIFGGKPEQATIDALERAGISWRIE